MYKLSHQMLWLMESHLVHIFKMLKWYNSVKILGKDIYQVVSREI